MSPVVHEALLYAGAGEFAPTCCSIAEEAFDAGRPVLILAADRRIADLRDALGDRREDVTFVPTDTHGRNPVRITALLDSFRSAGNGRRPVALTEWGLPGRSSAVLAETQLAESLLNAATLRQWPLELLCLYDAAALPEPLLAGMRRTHPAIRGEAENLLYEPQFGSQLFAAELTAGPEELEVADVGPAGLSAARATVRAFAEAAGLPGERVEDLVVAANEIVTNSIRHGGGVARLALWQQDGSVLCQVADRGHITDPLVGRLPPTPAAGSGRGLWLANQLCDLVQVRSSPAGTVVRLYVDRL